jgi:hypothetical protein
MCCWRRQEELLKHVDAALLPGTGVFGPTVIRLSIFAKLIELDSLLDTWRQDCCHKHRCVRPHCDGSHGLRRITDTQVKRLLIYTNVELQMGFQVHASTAVIWLRDNTFRTASFPSIHASAGTEGSWLYETTRDHAEARPASLPCLYTTYQIPTLHAPHMKCCIKIWWCRTSLHIWNPQYTCRHSAVYMLSSAATKRDFFRSAGACVTATGAGCLLSLLKRSAMVTLSPSCWTPSKRAEPSENPTCLIWNHSAAPVPSAWVRLAAFANYGFWLDC